MKHVWRRMCLSAFAALAVLFLAAPAAYADVNDFTINDFIAEYTLTRADPQGELHVVESIEVTFTDQNHGILRAIPNTYKNHRLQLHIADVTTEEGCHGEWTTYQSNGNTVLKIGDPTQTVTGKHYYWIEYTLRNVIGFYDDHDELFWDINGDQWAQPAEHVSMDLHLPPDITPSKQQPICYTGKYGSQQHACTIHYDKQANTVSALTTGTLQPYQTLSTVTGFEKGYFHPSTWQETAMEYAAIAAKFLVPVLLLGGVAGRYWFRYGRDAKGKGVIVPEYEAPNGLTPIEVGTIIDFKTNNRDISATIIDLAVRGYITIIENTQKRRLRKDIKTYALRLNKSDFGGLTSFESRILRSLFESQLQSNHPEGGEVELEGLKYKLASAATALRSSVREHLTSAGYFRKNPITQSFRFAGMIGVTFLICFVLSAIFGGAAVLGTIAGTLLVVLFLTLMPSRLPKGVEAKERIQGLKLYLETAEADRLKKLQSPDAAYAPKSAEPKKTVELYEKLLPYAIALGVESEWSKQFEDIYRTPPDWYQGNWTTFSAVYLASSLNSGVQSAVNTAFSSPSSSGSSGFSGGGAGGGGGGGGGGGW